MKETYHILDFLLEKTTILSKIPYATQKKPSVVYFLLAQTQTHNNIELKNLAHAIFCYSMNTNILPTTFWTIEIWHMIDFLLAQSQAHFQ